MALGVWPGICSPLLQAQGPGLTACGTDPELGPWGSCPHVLKSPPCPHSPAQGFRSCVCTPNFYLLSISWSLALHPFPTHEVSTTHTDSLFPHFPSEAATSAVSLPLFLAHSCCIFLVIFSFLPLCCQPSVQRTSSWPSLGLGCMFCICCPLWSPRATCAETRPARAVS